MKLIETFEVTELTGETVEWVKLERAENEFTWMSKATYDEQQAALSTPIDTLVTESAPTA